MTDHVHNQLCARIEELEKEKLELNEQMDALQEERDSYQHQFARATEVLGEIHEALNGSGPAIVGMEAVQVLQLKGERDALAAHVERIISEWNSGDELFSDEWINRMGDIVDDAPATSLARLKAQWQAEADRLDWLEQQARKSRTGISFDWVPTCESEPSGFRFMRRHFIGEPAKTLRDAIDRLMRAEGGET